MSLTKKYIHISSSYRNRNLFPNPAQFEIPISQRGNPVNALTAVDPIITSYPLLGFDCSFLPWTANFVGGTCTEPIISPPPVLPSGYAIGDDFYVGMTILDNISGELSSITSYNSLTDRITLAYPYTDTWTFVGHNYTISLPVYNTSSNILIPSGTPNNGAYVGYVLEDTDIAELRTIISYDGDNRIATISPAFGAGWASTDIYSLRLSMPYVNGLLVVSTGNYTYNSVLYQYVQLSANGSSVEDAYTNFYFFDNTLYISGVDENYSLIVKYFGNNPPLGSGLPNNVALLNPTMIGVNIADIYDILAFTRDNFSPLVYIGSLTQELACYEMELVSLVLPNVDIISTSGGGRAINVPYVYVEFSNLTTNSKNSIASNNLGAGRALFLVSLMDYPSVFNSPFVRVDGGNQIQVIKFKNGDNFKFSVFLPNGDLFITTLEDDFSPLPPNNSLQIEMTISTRRLS